MAAKWFNSLDTNSMWDSPKLFWTYSEQRWVIIFGQKSEIFVTVYGWLAASGDVIESCQKWQKGANKLPKNCQILCHCHKKNLWNRQLIASYSNVETWFLAFSLGTNRNSKKTANKGHFLTTIWRFLKKLGW